AERNAHRDFDEAGVVDFAGEREDSGAGRFRAADGFEPRRAAKDDPRRHRVTLHIVDVARFAPETADGGERRPRTRFAAAAFDGGDEGGFFATNKCAGTAFEDNVKAELGAEDVRAEQSEVGGLCDGRFEPVDGERVFFAAVNDAFPRAHRVTGDGHAFEDGVRIAFEDRPVHERAGIALVGVADDVLDVAGRFAAQFPFHAGREPPAAAAAQAGFLDFANDFLGRPRGEGAGECAVTVAGDVLFNFFWIDDAAVGEHDPDLFAGEWQVTELRDVLNRLRLVGGRFGFGHAADGPFPDRPAVDDVFLDQTRHHVGLDVGIKHMR